MIMERDGWPALMGLCDCICLVTDSLSLDGPSEPSVSRSRQKGSRRQVLVSLLFCCGDLCVPVRPQ
jgi:hypothetical protein